MIDADAPGVISTDDVCDNRCMKIMHPIFRTQPRQTNVTRHTLCLSVLVLLSGCSILKRDEALPVSPTAPSSPAPKSSPTTLQQMTVEQIMTNDLLSAVVQILPPQDTIIQVSASEHDELTLTVADALTTTGFPLQKVMADQGANLLSTEMQTEQNQAGSTSRRPRITIGSLSVSRSYMHSAENAIQPNSAFKVYGSTAPINVQATLFGAGTAATTSLPTEYAAPIGVPESIPNLSLITPEVVQRVIDSTVGAPDPTAFNSAQVEVNNLFYSQSTFSSMLDERESVKDLTVIFPNDSLTLGPENKLLIREFMKDFVEQKDVVSLIGCSNGPTALAMGNEGLALGRAERVTDELITLGVPREKILDEGCWAPQGNIKELPGRGVVLKLFRGA